MTSPSEPRTTPQLYHAAPAVARAVWLTGGAIATIYVVQIGLFSLLGGVGAAIAGYLVVIAEVGLAARAQGFSLGLRRPAARFLIAALLIGLACWYLGLQLVSWLVPHGDAQDLEAIVARTPLPVALFGIALLPALAEELVFRGVLARGLARHGAALAIGVSAIVFCAFHLRSIQGVAIFPLALALGTLAVRSQSVVPGMLAHFLNNATVLVVANSAAANTALGNHPHLAFAGAIVMVGGGVALAAKATPA